MFDAIKQTMLIGIGLAAMTKDKVEQMAREMAENAKASAEKGQEFVKEVTTRAEKARADMDATVRRIVDDTLKRTNVATRDQIAGLETRLARLEELLAQRAAR